MEIPFQPDRTTSTCAVIVKDAFQVSTLRACVRQVSWKTFSAIQSLYFIWKQNLKTDYSVRFLFLLRLYSFLFTFFFNSSCEVCGRCGVSLLPSLVLGRGDVYRIDKVQGCIPCCSRLECIQQVHNCSGRS